MRSRSIAGWGEFGVVDPGLSVVCIAEAVSYLVLGSDEPEHADPSVGAHRGIRQVGVVGPDVVSSES